MQFTAYDTASFFDEMFEADCRPRAGAALLVQRIQGLPAGELLRRQRAAEQALLHMGITFNVYGDAAGTERIFPFDVIPRIVEAADWTLIERGLKQRIQALNLFIDDIYQAQHIINDGIVPPFSSSLPNVFSSPVWACDRRAASGAILPALIWCVTATDKFTSLKIICAALQACRTCWKIARCSNGRSPRF